MKQITEDYISFEIAQLLKEKGFNEEVRTFYNSKGIFEYCSFPLNHNLDIGSGFTSAPSQSLALKWLREVHHLDVCILMNGYGYFFNIVHNAGTCVKDGLGEFNVTYPKPEEFETYPQYEQAVEAALLYVLKNLI